MRPILYQWDGGAMRPVGRMQALADQQFVPGERYVLELSNNRSMAEHRQYFAWLHEAWTNLPEHLEKRWIDPDRLRKWALIRAGHCKTKTYPAKSEAEARRYIKTETEDDDEVEIERFGYEVTIHWAKSQSFEAMTAAEFRASKEAVVAIVSMLIGTTPEILKRESLSHA
jgi:hypothetical protein